MLQRFEHNFRKSVALSLVTAGVMAFAITGFAVAANRTTFVVAASESRPITLKTNCNAKADKLLRMLEAKAPVIK